MPFVDVVASAIAVVDDGTVAAGGGGVAVAVGVAAGVSAGVAGVVDGVPVALVAVGGGDGVG